MPKIRYAETNTVNGYYMPHWFSVVMPEETENLILNPSVENDTTGYTAVGAGAAIARTLDEQRRGAYSIRVTPAVGVASGVYYGTISTAINEPYTFSLDVLGVAGHVYNVYFADNAGARVGASYEFIASGYWQRVKITFVEDTGAVVRRLYLVQDAGDVQPFYTDGWQVENKSYDTTYCDGDLTGFVTGEVAYYWTGLYHGSTSVRVSTTRSGGRIVNLREYGFRLLGSQGLGLAPVINYSLPSNLGGAYYQSTVEGVREFSLIGDICFEHYYQVSRAKSQLEQAFSYNLTPYRQPLLLHFQETDDCGAAVGEEVYIKCLYDSGLEGVTDNLTGEKFAIRFIAFDKDALIADGETAISLDYKNVMHFDGTVRRRTDGDFDVLNTSISAFPNSGVRAVINDGFGGYYAVGSFTSINGVAASRIAHFSNGTWSALGAGVDDVAWCMQIGNDGRLYVGGQFLNAGGAPAARIAVWDPIASTWAALGLGLTGVCYNITLLADGRLFVGGDFVSAGGAVVNSIAIWDPTAATWSAVGTGLDVAFPSPIAECAIRSPSSNSVYIGGNFTSVNGGTTVNYVCKIDLDTTTFSALGPGLTSAVTDLAFDARQYLYAYGPTITLKIWNGSSWSDSIIPLAAGSFDEVILEQLTNEIIVSGSIGAVTDSGAPNVFIDRQSTYSLIGLKTGSGSRNLSSTKPGEFVYSIDLFGGYLSYAVTEVANIIPVKYGYTVDPTVVMKSLANSIYPWVIRKGKMFSQGIGFSPVTAYAMSINEILSIHIKSGDVESSIFGNVTNSLISGSMTDSQFENNDLLIVYAIESIDIYNDNQGPAGARQLHQLINLITGLNLTNTNNGRIYISIVLVAAGVYRIDIFSDAARLNLTAHTANYTASGVYALIEDNNSGLGGYISVVTATAADADIYADVGVLETPYFKYRTGVQSLSQARY